MIKEWFKKKTKKNIEIAQDIVGAQQIKESALNIKELGEKLLSPKYMIKNAHNETFEDAIQRLHLNQIDILKSYKNASYNFYINFFSSLISLSVILYTLFIKQNILWAIPMLAILFVFFANLFRYSFRAYQIKHQSLCSVQEWWNNAQDWFPKLF